MMAALALLLSISGAMGCTSSGRKLLGSCDGGCARWIGGGTAGRKCAACCGNYVMRGGTCVASSTVVTTAPVYPANPVYRPAYRGPVSASSTTAVRVSNPPGPRGTTVTTATRQEFRGLKQIQLFLAGAAAQTDASRHLLGCQGGCASWVTQRNGRRTCAACCGGYNMQNGACVAQSTAVKKNPAGGTTATRTTAAGYKYSGH